MTPDDYLDRIDRLLREGRFQLTDAERMMIREVYNAVTRLDLEAAREAWLALPEQVAAAMGAPPEPPPDGGEGVKM